MTEKTIQESLMKFLYPQSNRIMDTNFSGFGLGECDLIAISDSKIISEFEIKISRGDFKIDFKKLKHEKIREIVDSPASITNWGTRGYACPQKFSYVCPAGLISLSEIPSHYGLYYVSADFTIERVQMPKLLHHKKASSELIEKIARQITSKMTFGCAYLTHKNKKAQDAYRG